LISAMKAIVCARLMQAKCDASDPGVLGDDGSGVIVVVDTIWVDVPVVGEDVASVLVVVPDVTEAPCEACEEEETPETVVELELGTDDGNILIGQFGPRVQETFKSTPQTISGVQHMVLLSTVRRHWLDKLRVEKSGTGQFD